MVKKLRHRVQEKSDRVRAGNGVPHSLGYSFSGIGVLLAWFPVFHITPNATFRCIGKTANTLILLDIILILEFLEKYYLGVFILYKVNLFKELSVIRYE